MDKNNVKMGRREILQGSIQGLTKMLRSILSINGERNELLQSMEGATRLKRARCFPIGREKKFVFPTTKSDNKEE